MHRKTIYLDHAASAPTAPSVLTAMVPHLREMHANPHAADHAAGWAAAEAIEEARSEIAARIGADPDEIVFTSGATEANNLSLLGLGGGALCGNVVVSAVEHKAVLGPARELARRGLELRIAPVDERGVVDVDAMRSLIDGETLVAALMLVNNEVGTVQPVAEIAEACARTGALLHVDAAQALSWMTMDVDQLGADFLSLSGHKAGGPMGIGALYVRRDSRRRLRPIMFGGEQEDGLRPGTLPAALCVGLGAACRARPDAAEIDRWKAGTRRLEQSLLALATGARLNGDGAARHPGCASLTLPGIDAEALAARLQPRVALSRGSACTSGIPEPSHVLRAMGLTAAETAATIRISTGRGTTDAEIDEAAALIGEAVASLLPESRAAA